MFPALIHYYMSHSLYLYSPPPLVRKLPSTLCHLIFNCPVIKRFLLFGRKVMTNLDSSIKEQRHHFTNKGPSTQKYGFSSSHVWIWEMDYKELWVLKNWCFWTVVFKKTLESPLDCKEIQPVHPKGNQSWTFVGRTDAEAEIQYLATWCEELTHWKRLWCWGRLKVGGKGTTEDEIVGWQY